MPIFCNPGMIVSAIVRLCAAAALMLSATSAQAQSPHAERLTLVVPGAAGGGWDLTAKAMKVALEREGLVASVNIVRYPGTGGLVGLSQFVSRHRGQDDVLLIGGLTMLGSAMADDAAISLRDVAPIARLAGDWGLIAVRSDSPIHSIDDLKRAMLTRSNALRWSGGALGSPDQALVWNIASQLRIPLDDVLYYGKVGGRRAAEALLDRRSDVAISGYAEFHRFMNSGEFRAVAVDSPRRLAGLDVPTLRESGLDVSIMNWRGVFAPPGLTTAQQHRLGAIIGAMQATGSWRAALTESRWTPAYLDAQGFSQFIDRETARWPQMINPPSRGDGEIVTAAGVSATMLWILGAVATLLALAAGQLILKLRRRQRIEHDLESRCGELTTRLSAVESAKGQLVLDGIKDDFGEWNLSFAERDVAWFMLRGLPLKQIAGLRGTSERTVRQQAQAIYRKAGLEGRSDLAGRVLERFI